MTFDSTINEPVVNKAISPLRLIFWGGLLCIVDFNLSQTTNGQGVKFDIFSDLLGTVLIAVGVFRLGNLPVHDRYASKMKFVKIVSVLGVLDAIQDHFIPPLVQLSLAFNLWGLLNLAAIFIFCIAMRWFCEVFNLNHAAQSWSTTTKLFVVIYLIPLGLFYILGTLATFSGAAFDANIGPLAIFVLPIFAIPLIHLFMSTSRMKRAAEMWLPVTGPQQVRRDW